MRKRQRPRYLVAALTANGRLVHLVDTAAHKMACGNRIADVYRVRARITCQRCRAKFPRLAARRDGHPLVVGVNHEPFYRAVRAALDAGAEEMPPPPRVSFWPVLG